MQRRAAVVVILAASLAAAVPNGRAPAADDRGEPGITARASVGSDGAQWTRPSAGSAVDGAGPAISADGRHVAFVAAGQTEDGEEPSQVYVRDRVAGTTTLVSRTPSGGPGDRASSGQPAVSADGRYVAFESAASDLVGPYLEPRRTDAPDLVDASVVSGNEGFVRLTFDEPAWDTCPGTGPCTVTMGTSTARTAIFGSASFPLSVEQTDGGKVVSKPDGIECGDVCTATFSADSVVTLTPDPAVGRTFAGWSGACQGTGPCSVTMAGARSVAARFEDAPLRTLTVAMEGPGGTKKVKSNPDGINCPDDCSGDFRSGESVTLTASADGLEAFWSVSTCTGSTCVVKADQAQSVTVKFLPPKTFPSTTDSTGNVSVTVPSPVLKTVKAVSLLAAPPAAAAPPQQATLDVDLLPTGTAPVRGAGKVTSVPAGIECAPRCSASLPVGTAVTLAAEAGQNARFVGWSGYRLVLEGGPLGDTVVPCTPVSGDGTAVHLVDCLGLGERKPWRAYVEPGTVADSPAGGVANPLQARRVADPDQVLSSPYLTTATLDVGAIDDADVVLYFFNQDIQLLDARAFSAYLADGTTVAASEVVAEDCCRVRAVFPDGSLRSAVGASIRAGAVRDTGRLGGHRQANLADETGLVNGAGDGNRTTDVFVTDRDADGNGVFDEPGPGAMRVTMVSVGADGLPADGPSGHPSISADGRSVAFQSRAPNLIPAGFFEGPGPSVTPAGGGEFNDTNGVSDVFVHDRDADGDGVFDEGGSAERTSRVSLTDDGSQIEGDDSLEPAISATGRYVAFASGTLDEGGSPVEGSFEVLVRDRDADADGVFDETAAGAASTRLISLGPAHGRSESPAISADGRLVALETLRSQEPSQVLLRDRDADGDGVFDEPEPNPTMELVSVGPSGAAGRRNSLHPALSGDGRYVSFFSEATDLVPSVPGAPVGDIYVRDRLRARTTVVSVAPAGGPGDAVSDSASSLSADGRSVTFASEAANLVASDTNGVRDVFVRDRLPAARIVPDPAGFGSVALGDRSEPQVLRLDNVGVGPLRVGAISLEGPAAADFSVDAQSCTGTVLPSLPGRECTISVSFAPSELGRRPASLVVAHDPAPADRTVVALEGVGVQPPNPVNPARLDFGTVGVGFSSDRTTAVVNLGRLPRALGALAISGSGEFSLVPGACPSPLRTGASCIVRVRFTPAGPGPRSASLSGTIGPQPFAVDLAGTGATGVLQLGPDPLDFGTLAVGATADRATTVTNAGLGLLRLDRVDLAGPGYSVVTDGCTAVNLDPGATCTVALRLVPAVAGTLQGTLIAHATAAGAPAPSTASLGLVGTASAAAAKASINPNPLVFGDQDVGVPATRTVTVTDEGPGPLPLGTITLAGASPGDFAVAVDHCSGRTLAVGASCTVEFGFSPTAAGPRAAVAVVPGAGSLDLAGSGLLYTPVLTLSVTVGTPGTVTLAQGTGFRPNAQLSLRWVAADPRPDAPVPLSAAVDVQSDAAGRFGPAPVPVLQKDVLGPRTLEARGHLPGTVATASFLVVAGSARPAGADVILIRHTTLVNRG